MARFQLSTKDQNKWINNLITFFIPVGLLYLTTVIGAITAADGLVEPGHFIPNQLAVGGITLYILNSLFDILRKFASVK